MNNKAALVKTLDDHHKIRNKDEFQQKIYD